jgi:hypothetical protein
MLLARPLSITMGSEKQKDVLGSEKAYREVLLQHFEIRMG